MKTHNGAIIVTKNKKREITNIHLSFGAYYYDIPRTIFFELLYQYGYIKRVKLSDWYVLSDKGEQFFQSKYPNA